MTEDASLLMHNMVGLAAGAGGANATAEYDGTAATVGGAEDRNTFRENSHFPTLRPAMLFCFSL